MIAKIHSALHTSPYAYLWSTPHPVTVTNEGLVVVLRLGHHHMLCNHIKIFQTPCNSYFQIRMGLPLKKILAASRW